MTDSPQERWLCESCRIGRPKPGRDPQANFVRAHVVALTEQPIWRQACRAGPRLIVNLSLALGIWALVPNILAGEKSEPLFTASPHARFYFDGVVGQRLKANVDNWLLPAPQANPGMLEMFQMRDRLPTPNLVPWAGEFVGNYLISAIQALRMNEHPELRSRIAQTVAAFLASQAEDGYLGPFPRETRLKANWDLWGHYHAMLALLMWHEATGDSHALKASQRAADLVCRTFLDSNLRVRDAGSHEMNMAIIHSLGRLYRVTRERRYLQMMREIEKDWQETGDYHRTGLAGVEFFQTPRPRWESLHDLQGLVELYRITGDDQYRLSFVQHWRSILRWDRRNTGGFSSGEQATGNPYAPTPIETCCTVAWMALTVDMLQLTGEARAADELELSFYNAALGAQHASGRWCTYNTPMDGTREGSAHTIVFQARAGTPELNCCSVNGPRGLGLLSEWAVLTGKDSLMVNSYGPGMFQGKLADNTPVALHWATDYPLSGKVLLRVEPLAPRKFRLLLRIPAWSTNTSVEVNGKAVANVLPGGYVELDRRWQAGDRIAINFDMRLRAVPGDREALGRVSVYRGPLLLAYDQALNDFDEDAIPALDLTRLQHVLEIPPGKPPQTNALVPWLVLELFGDKNRGIRVCDFASAGASGTRYKSWLRTSQPLPPPVVTRIPADGAAIPVGETLFRWTGPKRAGEHVSEYHLLISLKPDLSAPVLSLPGLRTNRIVLGQQDLSALVPGKTYWWNVVSVNSHGRAESVGPPARFRVDAGLAPALHPPPTAERPDGLLVSAKLAGQANPDVGKLRSAVHLRAAVGQDGSADAAVRTDGEKALVSYEVEEFPEEDYTMTVWVNLEQFPEGRIGQVCSAWTAGLDDPLRVCIDNGKLFARIEAGQGYSTTGVPVRTDRWHHVAAVKSGTELKLYLDGETRAHATVPLFVYSNAKDIALGGNPHYGGNEFLAARFARFSVHGRALTDQEIKAAFLSR